MTEQRDENTWKLAEEVSRERHMKDISPVQSISLDTFTWTFFSYNNKYIICYGNRWLLIGSFWVISIVIDSDRGHCYEH